MRIAYLMLVALALLALPALADTLVQTDWSLGGGQPGPVVDPGGSFDSAADIAWRSIPGQISLAATPLTPCPEHLINDAYYRSFGLEAADIDQDGDTDVVGAAEQSGVVSVWWNDGTDPVTWHEQVIDGTFPGADGIAIADIDADGRLDVICNASTPGNRIAWWRNEGGDPIAWSRQIIATAWPTTYEISTADVDSDGHLDVVCTSWDAGVVAWWRNDGGTPIEWTQRIIDGGFPGAHSAWGADFDGDGDTDIAGTSGTLHQVAWWRNEGGDPIAWTKHVIREGFTGGRSVHPADIDDDGDIDLVGTAWTNEVTWWSNDGGDPLQWTQQVIDPNFNGGHFVWVADIDGNGRLDVLGSACNGGDVIWFGNEGGSPITWSRHVVDGNYSAVIEARTGDLNGDGALDILASSYTLGTFSWWEVTQFVASGELTSSILDLEEVPGQVRLEWSASVPGDTELSFQMRSADDPLQMGDWSAEMTQPGNLPGPLGRYAQYRARLETTAVRRSPIVNEVVLHWLLPGAVPDSESRGGLPFWVPSPAGSQDHLCLVLTDSRRVELAILDLAGRIVSETCYGRLGAGRHELALPKFHSGVYFCRLSAGPVAWNRRVVIVE